MNEIILFVVFMVIIGFIGPKDECKNTPCECRKCKST